MADSDGHWIRRNDELRVKYDDGAYKLTRAHPTDAGLDIRAIKDGIVRARQSATFHTGVHIELAHEIMGDIRPKSGLMFSRDILTFGTVDEGYDGEIMIHMFNLGNDDFNVKRGDKIAQLVTARIVYDEPEEATEIKGGERGSAGFGSTGR